MEASALQSRARRPQRWWPALWIALAHGCSGDDPDASGQVDDFKLLDPFESLDAGMDAQADGAEGECSADDVCLARLGVVVPAGCATARCVSGKCTFEVADSDLDGEGASACTVSSGIRITIGWDCDDSDPGVNSKAWDGPPLSDGYVNRCNGVDDDCDGFVDNDMLNGARCECDASITADVPCDQLADGTAIDWPTGSPLGNCRRGTRRCMGGTWTRCMGAVAPLPQDRCEGQGDDANCNGKLSEGCGCVEGKTQYCGSSIGSCKQGLQTCVNGKWDSTCAGGVEKKLVDSCEPGNDDNCNGTPNDGCTCVEGTSSTCGEKFPTAGDCFDRAIKCTAGRWPESECKTSCNDCPMINPCAPGTCVDEFHGFSCNCPAGSAPDGKTCKPVEIDECFNNSACAPGKCIDGDNTFSCDCPPDYAGDFLQSCTKIDDCPKDNPCLPGSCVDGYATFHCDCPIDYVGDTVCTKVNDCPASNPCAPGVCIDGVNTFACNCPPTHEGTYTKSCTPKPDGGVDPMPEQ